MSEYKFTETRGANGTGKPYGTCEVADGIKVNASDAWNTPGVAVNGVGRGAGIIPWEHVPAVIDALQAAMAAHDTGSLPTSAPAAEPTTTRKGRGGKSDPAPTTEAAPPADLAAIVAQAVAAAMAAQQPSS